MNSGNDIEAQLCWVRIGTGEWDHGRLELVGPALAVHRSSGTLLLPFDSVEQVEEVESGQDGWPTIEVFQFSGATYELKLSADWLSLWLSAMWAARRSVNLAQVPPAPQSPSTATPAQMGLGWEPVGQTPTSVKRARRTVASIAAVVLVLGGAVYGMAQKTKSHDIIGTYLLKDESEEVAGSFDDCEGTGGYGDFAAGAEVTVSDDSGEVLGSSTLRNVFDAEEAETYLVDTAGAEGSDLADLVVNDDYTYCLLVFDVTVDVADNYSVEIGGGGRGSQDYSREEFEESDWTVAITLGFD